MRLLGGLLLKRDVRTERLWDSPRAELGNTDPSSVTYCTLRAHSGPQHRLHMQSCSPNEIQFEFSTHHQHQSGTGQAAECSPVVANFADTAV